MCVYVGGGGGVKKLKASARVCVSLGERGGTSVHYFCEVDSKTVVRSESPASRKWEFKQT